MNRFHLLSKIIGLSLALTTVGFTAVEAAHYGPGTITDTSYTYASQPAISDAGNYTIVNSNSDTLQLNASGNYNTLISYADTSNALTVTGNLVLNTTYIGHGLMYNSGKELTINGDFSVNANCSTQMIPGGTVMMDHGHGSITNYNGNVTINAHNQSNYSASAFTTFRTSDIGTIVNVNGNFHLTNEFALYLGSSGGGNGIYAQTGSQMNFNGDEFIVQSISYKPDSITSRQGSQINVNAKTVQVIGTMDMKDSYNSTLGKDSEINITFDGANSYWYGDLIYTNSNGHLNILFKNGAQYIPFGTLSLNQYGAKKYLSSIELESGGQVNLYDANAKAIWQSKGLDTMYSDLMDTKLDYLLIGDLKGTDGSFSLDMNSQDRSQTDMLYILNSTSGAGQNNIQAYSENEFANVNENNTLRFASVAAAAADKLIFKDQMNLYGKTLWDYQLLIGHSAYDVNDPENAIYNSRRDGLTASQIDTFMTNGMNWYIYGYVKKPSTATITLLDSAGAAYDLATDLDRYHKRHGESQFLDTDSNIWVRMKRAHIGRDGGYAGNYTMGQIGYERGNQKHQYGLAFDYTQGKSILGTHMGTVENTRRGILLYDTRTKENGSYLDLVARYGRIHTDINGYTPLGTSINGSYSNNAFTLSAEYGQKLKLHTDKLYIEPQAQLQYTRVGSASYQTNNNISSKIDGANSLIGRLGFRVGKEFNKDNNVYFKADILREFSGGQKVNLTASDGSTTYTYNGDILNRGTWFDVGIGTTLKLSKDVFFACDLERSFGGKLGANWEANASFKFTF